MLNIYVVDRATRKVVKRYMNVDDETAKHLFWFWDSETYFAVTESVEG